jgi:hypothetical protein
LLGKIAYKLNEIEKYKQKVLDLNININKEKVEYKQKKKIQNIFVCW